MSEEQSVVQKETAEKIEQDKKQLESQKKLENLNRLKEAADLTLAGFNELQISVALAPRWAVALEVLNQYRNLLASQISEVNHAK